MELTHNQIVRNTCYVTAEHKCNYSNSEKKISTREAIFSKYISSHRSKHNVSYGTNNSNKYCIPDIARKRNPTLTHCNKKVREVIKCRVSRKNCRRVLQNLIKRFKSITNCKEQWEYHHSRTDCQEDVNSNISSNRTVWLSSMFVMMNCLIFIHAFRIHFSSPPISVLLCSRAFE